MAGEGWLAGDVAFITGGGSGLGRALVERFIAEGAKIVALEYSPEKSAALVRDFGDDVAVVTGDVRFWRTAGGHPNDRDGAQSCPRRTETSQSAFGVRMAKAAVLDTGYGLVPTPKTDATDMVVLDGLLD